MNGITGDWLDADKVKPNDNAIVMIMVSGALTYGYYREGAGWHWFNYIGQAPQENPARVTHWRPFPPPPAGIARYAPRVLSVMRPPDPANPYRQLAQAPAPPGTPPIHSCRIFNCPICAMGEGKPTAPNVCNLDVTDCPVCTALTKEHSRRWHNAVQSQSKT